MNCLLENDEMLAQIGFWCIVSSTDRPKTDAANNSFVWMFALKKNTRPNLLRTSKSSSFQMGDYR
jgi:hypothetical protein